jgi:hypothetical protein
LIEELEAINWYRERIDATGNESLKKIPEHNRDEEKERMIRRRIGCLKSMIKK